jgi:hypothetical protein
MPSRALTAALWASLAIGASGCIIVNGGDGPGPQGGDISISWAFDGHTCAETPAVDQVQVTIPGEPLIHDGRFGCTNSSTDGITLHDFGPGTYSLRVEGLSVDATVLYVGTATVAVNGNQTVAVELSPAR